MQRQSQYNKTVADSYDPLYRKAAEALPVDLAASDFITSTDVTARKRG